MGCCCGPLQDEACGWPKGTVRAALALLIVLGAFIIAGVYDSGFNNTIGAVLRVDTTIVLEKGVRVAQIMFFEAESASLYDGVYQEGK